MLPDNNLVNEMANSYPGRTYYIDRNTNRISGYIDDKDALIQAIHLILTTERYESYIYNWYYGTEFDSLVGKDRSYVASELKRRIREALMEDDRIEEVNNFVITFSKDVATVNFTVDSSVGEININWEVNI